MNQTNKLSTDVFLIDASFLSYVISDLKRNFERMLGRTLSEINLQDLFIYMALDAGVKPGKNRIQVFFVYDENCAVLPHCRPSRLNDELHNTAFDCALGKFEFDSFQTAGMVSLDDLFLSSLQLLLNSEDVKRIRVVSFNEHYGERVHDMLKISTDKEILQFRMDKPTYTVPYRCDILAYSIMKAMGIRGDELV